MRETNGISTPLHIAVIEGNKILAGLPVQNGADVNIMENILGRTPLDIAKKLE
jgi:ankyrin repeat protein